MENRSSDFKKLTWMQQLDQNSGTKKFSPQKFRKDKRKGMINEGDLLTEAQENKMLERQLENHKDFLYNTHFQPHHEGNADCYCSICNFQRKHKNDHKSYRFEEKIDFHERRLYFYEGDTVWLNVSCRNLINVDGEFSKSDPYIVLSIKDEEGNWIYQGKTETIFDNLNPNFSKAFNIKYNPDEEQYLKFTTFHYSGSEDTEDLMMGETVCTVHDIIVDDEDQNVIYDIIDGVEIAGKIIIRAEKDNTQGSNGHGEGGCNINEVQNQNEHMRTVHKAEESDFGFIVRQLMYPQRIKQGLHINIPATIFFSNGRCKFMVYTHIKEKTLKFIKFYPKGVVNFVEIKKQMNEFYQEYEAAKLEFQYGEKRFEKVEHRKNYLLGEHMMAGITTIKTKKGMRIKRDMLNSAPLLECKECKHKYYQDGKACKWLCDVCRDYYANYVDTTCSCKEEGGCRLKVLYKKEDLKEAAIIKQQIIQPKTETDHPAFFQFDKDQKHNMIDFYNQHNSHGIQIIKSEEKRDTPSQHYLACLSPQLIKQKKIKFEFKFSNFKSSKMVGLGVVYSSILERNDWIYHRKVYGANDGFMIFGDGSINPINYNAKDQQKKAFSFKQGDVITMQINPDENTLSFMNKRTQQEYSRNDIIYKEGVNFLPCISISDYNDLVELITSVEVSEISLLTYKKTEQLSIMNEFEFQNIMLKRPFHTVWNTVQFIQNYIPQNGIKNKGLKKIQFDFEKEHNEPLFQRALIDIQIINMEICKANSLYVDRDVEYCFEQKLMRDDPEKYAKYMVYKIVNFIETLHKTKILVLISHWMTDEIGQMHLVNATNMRQVHSERPFVTQQEFAQKQSALAVKQLQSIEHLKEKYGYLENSEKIELYSKALFTFYEGKKNQLGIDLNFDPKQEYQESDNVFKVIYPEAQFELSKELDQLQQGHQFIACHAKEKIKMYDLEQMQKQKYQQRMIVSERGPRLNQKLIKQNNILNHSLATIDQDNHQHLLSKRNLNNNNNNNVPKIRSVSHYSNQRPYNYRIQANQATQQNDNQMISLQKADINLKQGKQPELRKHQISQTERDSRAWSNVTKNNSQNFTITKENYFGGRSNFSTILNSQQNKIRNMTAEQNYRKIVRPKKIPLIYFSQKQQNSLPYLLYTTLDYVNNNNKNVHNK